jgi:hypothetical protein
VVSTFAGGRTVANMLLTASPDDLDVSCATVDPAVADVLIAVDVSGVPAVASISVDVPFPSATGVSNVSGVRFVAFCPAVVGVPAVFGVSDVTGVPSVANFSAVARYLLLIVAILLLAFPDVSVVSCMYRSLPYCC